MCRVFLKDFLDRRDIYKQFVFAIVIYSLFSTFVKGNPAYQNITFSLTSLLFIGLVLITNIYYFVKTYTSKEGNEVYYELPVPRDTINLGFICAITIDTLVRKILLVAVAFFVLQVPLKTYITFIAMTPIICIIASLGVSTNVTNKIKLLTLIYSLAALLVISFLTYESELYLVSLVIMATYLYSIYKVFLRDVYFTSSSGGKKSRLRLGNYFFKFILSENVYLINTAGLVLMIVIFGLAFPYDIALPMVLMIATVNTPLMTIYSTEVDLDRYRRLLPAQRKSLDKDYLMVIFIYYLLVHLLIMLIFNQILTAKIIILILGLVVFETLGSFYLENKHPIKDRKTTTAVWKHPRKYILGVVAFLISFIVINILNIL